MKRRLSFAAPFVLVAACHHGGGPTDHNPPPPPQTKHYAEWQVYKSGDTCQAETPDEGCPPDTDCNPPPPMTIACPAGITENTPMKVYQETDQNGACYVDGPTPTKIDCPKDE
jgi:hypothetical protein